MMRYALLAVIFAGSAALSGCFNSNDNNNDFDPQTQNDRDVAADQANAQLAVDRTSEVIDDSPDVNGSNGVNIAEPVDINRITLPEANRAEPVAVTGANASL